MNKPLKNLILNKAHHYIEPAKPSLLFKYTSLMILSFLLSLMICPQFGFSFFETQIPFYHSFFHQQAFLCGAFCASVLFFTTHGLSFFFLTHYEKLKMNQDLFKYPILVFVFIFGILMLPLPGKNEQIDISYITAWILILSILLFISKKSSTKKMTY